MSSLFVRRAFFVVNAMVMMLPIHVHASSAGMCQAVFLSSAQEAIVVDWKSDRSYIETMKLKESMGQVDTFYSEKWETQIYHSNTGIPNAKGKAPLVDPESRAVVIFFHGSGTMKSSGRNFIANMNSLANMGISSISLDMPFHAKGPRSDKYNDSNYFMEWLRSIVLEAKKAGKPVYLAGHSFGPDVALEFATRYPKLIDGVIGLSPAGFTKVLANWYDKFTSKMKFGGNVEPNDAGGEWAYRMSQQFHWAKGKLADPTLVNPKLNVRILSGNREEYVPAPLDPVTGLPSGDNTYDVSVVLRKLFRNASITIEPGVGHYLFEAVDSNGYNVVQRELLLGMGENPANLKKLIEQTREENKNLDLSGQMAKKYSQDPLFRAWADMNYGPFTVLKMALQGQDRFAKKVYDSYLVAQKEREMELFNKVLNSKTTHPEFYEKYRHLIDKMNPKVLDNTLFVPWLQQVLKNGESA